MTYPDRCSKIIKLELANPGFAPKITGAKMSIREKALKRGLLVIDTPRKGEFVIINGVDCVLFRGGIEPYLSYQLHSRHNCKYETKKLLSSIGVSTPSGYLIPAGSPELLLLELYKKMNT